MPKLKENVSLSRFSHYAIGGPARFFFEAKNEKEVRWALKAAKAKKLPVFILGGGTNLLIDDKGFDGLILKPNITAVTVKGEIVTAGAGIVMAHLLELSVKRSLSGLEWAGGLPGTLGGAVRGNAGCFGGEIKDVIISVRSIDIKTMKVMERSSEECRFDYRASIFKKKNGREVVLSAKLHMHKGDKKTIALAIGEKVAYRKKNHPLDYPNIGSIFKNVPLATVHSRDGSQYEKAIRGATLHFRGSTFSVKTDPFPVISTAKLISESGLRGVSRGGAMFSAKHPNFIVNALGASSPDVKNLMKLAKAKVHQKFGVSLEEEVQLL